MAFEHIAAQYQDVQDRFFAKSGQPKNDPEHNGCWVWSGSLSGLGYGIFRTGKFGSNHDRGMLAHRFSFCLFHCSGSPIDSGIVVRHKCDNRACCNPTHLIGGTLKQNTADMISRGRAWFQQQDMRLKVREARSILSPLLVRYILEDARPDKLIARDYRIAAPHVRAIKQGHLWPDVFADWCKDEGRLPTVSRGKQNPPTLDKPTSSAIQPTGAKFSRRRDIAAAEKARRALIREEKRLKKAEIEEYMRDPLADGMPCASDYLRG